MIFYQLKVGRVPILPYVTPFLAAEAAAQMFDVPKDLEQWQHNTSVVWSYECLDQSGTPYEEPYEVSIVTTVAANSAETLPDTLLRYALRLALHPEPHP